MRKLPTIFLMVFFLLFLSACDGGGSSEPLPLPEDSSESESSAEAVSSSEGDLISSSSEGKSCSFSEELILFSSSVSSSSSALLSSSSWPPKSSSSIFELPCKTQTEDNCEYGTLVDDRDGQTYRTVRIGGQIWMAENLNYAYLQPTSTLDSSSWCYDNDPENCKKYGRLYIWSAAIDSAALFSVGGKGFGYLVSCGNMEHPRQCSPSAMLQGVCPSGWHLPLTQEWYELYSAVGEDISVLKAGSEWLDGLEGTDAFGFNALPSGYAVLDGERFCQMNEYTEFWSSEGDGEAMAFTAFFDRQFDSQWKTNAFSVRCLKDTIIGLEVSHGSMTDERDGRTYRTVTINGQTWMAENLNYAYLQPTAELDSSSWCYDNEPDSCDKYGRLYLWSAAMDSAALFSDAGKGCGTSYFGSDNSYPDCQAIKADTKMVRGVCPEKWHIPSEFELRALSDAVYNAAYFLKTMEGWLDGYNGKDSEGFGLLPSGSGVAGRNSIAFQDVLAIARTWSSSTGKVMLNLTVKAMVVSHDVNNIEFVEALPRVAFSVRCIKDTEE